jgi:hypothetical protein
VNWQIAMWINLVRLLPVCSILVCQYCAAVEAVSLEAEHARRIDFLRDFQPIFARHCHRCHGPDVQRSGFWLDVREVAMTPGELYAPNIRPAFLRA